MKTPTKEQIKCTNCTAKCGCYFEHLKEEFSALSLSKTPTKEQIEKVMSKSCVGVMVCQHCPYQGHCFAMAKKFITEWEKIRGE